MDASQSESLPFTNTPSSFPMALDTLSTNHHHFLFSNSLLVASPSMPQPNSPLHFPHCLSHLSPSPNTHYLSRPRLRAVEVQASSQQAASQEARVAQALPFRLNHSRKVRDEKLQGEVVGAEELAAGRLSLPCMLREPSLTLSCLGVWLATSLFGTLAFRY